MTSYTWTGGSNSDTTSWNSQDNWGNDSNQPGVPGAGDVAIFGDKAALISDSGSADEVMVDDDGSLTIQGTITTSEWFEVNGGSATIQSGGQVSASGPGPDSQDLTILGGGSITVDDSTLDASGPGGAGVGSGGEGTLTIEGGASASFSSVTKYESLAIGLLGGTGTVVVEGSGSSLTTTGGGVEVGCDSASNGFLFIDDGATASISTDDMVDPLSIGQANQGGVYLDDSGTSLDVSGGGSVVGFDSGGYGVLNIYGGATASFSNTNASGTALTVGADDGTGYMEVNGVGSTLTVSDSNLVIGDSQGDGSLDVTNHGEVRVSQGRAVVGVGEGVGSLTIGVASLGRFTSDPGVYALVIGNQSFSSGSVFVEGSGALLTVAGGGLGVGLDDAPGYLNIDDDGQVVLNPTAGGSASFDIASGGGYGKVTVDGSGTALTTTGAINVGLSGQGSLTIDDGASLNSEYTGGPSIDIGVTGSGFGDVAITGSATNITLNQGQGIIVGNDGMGFLTVDKGATFEAGSNSPTNIFAVVVGNSAGSLGDVGVDFQATMNVGAGGMLVGGSGKGIVDVSDGTLNVSDSTYGLVIAQNTGSTGDVDVHTGAAALMSSGPVQVGLSGTGSLTINGNATFTSTYSLGPSVDIGVSAGGNGLMTVTNSADVTLNQGDGVIVGDAGTGLLQVDDGATLAVASVNPDKTYALSVGSSSATSNGTVNLTGAGSNLTVGAGGLAVGFTGNGALYVDDGATLNVVDTQYGLVIGDNATGNVVVSGQDAILQSTGPISIGVDGAGTVTVKDGGSLQAQGSSSYLLLGVNAFSSGNLILDDDATTPGANGGLTVGDSGGGQFSLEEGASWTSDDEVIAADDDGSTGAIKIEGEGSALVVGDLYLGRGGAGTLNVDDGASLVVNGDATEAEDDGASNATTVSGDDTTVVYDDDDVIGSLGNADDTISDGAAITVRDDLTLGDQYGGVGKLTVTGDGSGATQSTLTFGGTLTVGGSGAGTLVVANGGQVASNQSGDGEIAVAALSGSNGGVTVEGSGSMLQGETLAVGGSADAAGGSGTVDLSDGGVATTTDAIVWTGGLVTLAGGDLAASSVMLSGAGSIAGYGALSGDIESDSTGSITASAGDLALSGNIDSSATSFMIDDISAGSELAFSGAVGGAGVQPTITFGAGPNFGTLDLTGEGSGSTFGFNGLISGFAGKGMSASDVIDVTGSGQTNDKAVWSQTDPGVSGTLQIETAGGGVLESLTLDGIYVNGQFAVTDAANIDQVAYAACYVRGTRIATARGEIAIEALRIGDLAVTAAGALRPIVWIGHRKLDISRHADPAAVRPVRVAAEAFGDGLPKRELWLSPGHNVAFEGALISASALVNGRSVVQVAQGEVEYWHVELDAHDIIFAENLPAESYLDTGNRTSFGNGGAFIEAHPDFQPKHPAETCLPLATDGPVVARARAHLLARLAERGCEIVADADPHLIADGRRIDAIQLSPTRLGFVLPEGARDITLRSRVFTPAHTDLESRDPRELGLCVARLAVDGKAAALADKALDAKGWGHAEVVDGRFARRWTNGEAELPAGARLVIVDLAGYGYYWSRFERQNAASVA